MTIEQVTRLVPHLPVAAVWSVTDDGGNWYDMHCMIEEIGKKCRVRVRTIDGMLVWVLARNLRIDRTSLPEFAAIAYDEERP